MNSMEDIPLVYHDMDTSQHLNGPSANQVKMNTILEDFSMPELYPRFLSLGLDSDSFQCLTEKDLDKIFAEPNELGMLIKFRMKLRNWQLKEGIDTTSTFGLNPDNSFGNTTLELIKDIHEIISNSPSQNGSSPSSSRCSSALSINSIGFDLDIYLQSIILIKKVC